MGLLWTILIGFVAGVIAKFLMPGKDPGGFIVTTLLGIGGAVVAKFLGEMLGLYGPGSNVGLIGSVVGAMLILGLYRFLKGRKKAEA